MARSADAIEVENFADDTTTAGRTSLIQAFEMLGKGYFQITLIGILSFALLFLILWFM